MSRVKLGMINAGVGFLAGVLTVGAIAWRFGNVSARPGAVEAATAAAVAVPAAPPVIDDRPMAVALPLTTTLPPAVSVPADQPESVPVPAQGLSVGKDWIADLRGRGLEIPVQGVQVGALRESFDEMRDGTRKHNGIDILAARYTPVLAVEDGKVAKLFTSVLGGITVYEFDPTKTYIYYYAHLDRYADGLVEGAALTRRQVLGYVGTSGNAPPNTPHLHFEITRMTSEKQWWKGTSIDPFRVFRQ